MIKRDTEMQFFTGTVTSKKNRTDRKRRGKPASDRKTNNARAKKARLFVSGNLNQIFQSKGPQGLPLSRQSTGRPHIARATRAIVKALGKAATMRRGFATRWYRSRPAKIVAITTRPVPLDIGLTPHG